MTEDHQQDEFVRHVLLSAMEELKSLPNGSSTLKTIAEASKGIPMAGAPVRVLLNSYDCVKTKIKTAKAQMAIESALPENQSALEWPMHFSKAIILFALEIYFCFQTQFQVVKLKEGNAHGATRILGDLFGKTLVQSMADTAKSVDSNDQRKIISKLSKILNFDNLAKRMSTKADQFMGKNLNINCDGSSKNISAFQFFETPAPIFYFLQSKKYYTNEKAKSTKTWKYRRCLIGEGESDGLKKFPFPPTPSTSTSGPDLEKIVASGYFTHQFPLEDGEKQVQCLFEKFQHRFEFKQIYEAWKTKMLQEIHSKLDQVLNVVKELKDRRVEPLVDSSSSGESSSSESGIWFNIPEPIDSFCGREDFLTQLHEQLKPRDDAETEVTVLSQVKIVSGLGGIGKTQTARKYISKHRHFYNNFIWIDAETEISITDSFLKLAEKIKIPVKNSEGKSREIQEIVKEIYNKICEGGKSNLIVFDNAEDYLSCRHFFPFGLHPDLTKPVILATSRNQEWISPTGKIHVLPLDKMTDDESLEFILKQLEIPESEIPGFKEESREFIELIGGLPLALQQAVAYIKQKKKTNRLLRRRYKMRDYVKEFKSSTEKLLKFSHAPDSSTTIFITWEITLKKIRKDPNGKIAIEIIEAMSFLYANKIPVEFLLELLPLPPPPPSCINWLCCFFKQQHEDFQSKDLVNGLIVLEKFSMIKTTGDFASIHRQVQFVILENLNSSGGLMNLFNHLIEKCSGILKKLKISRSSDIFLNMHQIVNNSLDLIPVAEEFLDFMAEFGDVLFDASRYSESLELCKKVCNKYLELLGENHTKILTTQHQMALNLGELGKYEESLTLLKEIQENYENHPDFGVEHPATIATRYNIAAVLRKQGKYGEALELLEQVLDQENKIHGETGNHPEILKTQNHIVSVHADLGNFTKALALLKDIEEKRVEILGPNHRDVLQTKHNKAAVLYEMGQFQEASKIFNDVHAKYKEILGEIHLDTIGTLDWIGRTLGKEGKFKEALEIYKKVYEIRKQSLGEDHENTLSARHQMALNLGELGKYEESLTLFKETLEKKEIHPNLGVDHPETMTTNHNIADVLRKQGKYQESLEMFQQVLDQRKKIQGENHPETLKTQSKVALVHSILGDYSQALTVNKDLEKKQLEVLGPHHPDFVNTKHEKAWALFKMGQFEKATKIFIEVHEKRKEILGETHLNTIVTLSCIAEILKHQEKFIKVLEIYTKAYESRKTQPGHPDTVFLKTEITKVESKIKALSKGQGE